MLTLYKYLLALYAIAKCFWKISGIHKFKFLEAWYNFARSVQLNSV